VIGLSFAQTRLRIQVAIGNERRVQAFLVADFSDEAISPHEQRDMREMLAVPGSRCAHPG
jgi:hypothetical protein